MANEKTSTGDYSTGDCSTGNRSTGHYSTGDRSTGHYSTGHYSTGHYSTGDCSTGNRSTGHYSTGDRSTGNRSTGHYSTGDRSTGDCSTGNRSTGHYSTGDRSTGHFCTETPQPVLFDKPVPGKTWGEVAAMIPWVNLPIGCEWIDASKMTEAEKSAAPSHKTTGGFIRKHNRTVQQAFPLAWAKLDKATKLRFFNLPNFDADKFLVCTGVDARLDADLYPQPAPDTVPSAPELSG